MEDIYVSVRNLEQIAARLQQEVQVARLNNQSALARRRAVSLGMVRALVMTARYKQASDRVEQVPEGAYKVEV